MNEETKCKCDCDCSTGYTEHDLRITALAHAQKTAAANKDQVLIAAVAYLKFLKGE